MDYLFALQTIREGWGAFLTPVLYVISEFAFYGVPLVILVLYTSVDKEKYRNLVFTLVLANFAANFFKLLACVYRPWISDSRLHVHKLAEHSASGYSLPSGHTAGGTAFYGTLILNEKNGKNRKGIIALLTIMILLTAFARNWLGAHTVADVLTAIIITVICIFISELTMKWVDKNPEKDLIVVILGIVLAVISMVIFLVKSYPADLGADGLPLVDSIAVQKDSWLACGFLIAWVISWYIDRHYINFTTNISKKNKIIRGIISAVIFALLYEVIMKKIMGLMDIRIGALLRGFVSIFVVAGVYPMIFTRIENKRG